MKCQNSTTLILSSVVFVTRSKSDPTSYSIWLVSLWNFRRLIRPHQLEAVSDRPVLLVHDPKRFSIPVTPWFWSWCVDTQIHKRICGERVYWLSKRVARSGRST